MKSQTRVKILVAAAALLTYFAHDDSASLPIGKGEGEFARRFYQEEIRARTGRRRGS